MREWLWYFGDEGIGVKYQGADLLESWLVSKSYKCSWNICSLLGKMTHGAHKVLFKLQTQLSSAVMQNIYIGVKIQKASINTLPTCNLWEWWTRLGNVRPRSWKTPGNVKYRMAETALSYKRSVLELGANPNFHQLQVLVQFILEKDASHDNYWCVQIWSSGVGFLSICKC